jgi:probable F420-dependent oxidoreductase
MEIGLGIAQIGPFAGPDQLVAMAVGAEQRGYAALWALDRLLAPVAPRSAYPGNPEGLMPAAMATAMDPLVTLAAAASVTSTIRLGTNVLVAPWYRPALLARSLASLDVVSRGRLEIGLGLGWSLDEYEAVGVSPRGLGARQDDVLGTLEALWRPDAEAVGYDGIDFRIAPSSFCPRPVQRPRPRVLVAAYTPAGLERAGRRADGWTPAGLDLPTTAAMWGTVTAAAAAAGRDPVGLALVVRANVHHSRAPLGRDRPTFHGSVEQIADDVRGAFAVGASQVVLDLQTAVSDVEHYLDLADGITIAAGVRPGGPRVAVTASGL